SNNEKDFEYHDNETDFEYHDSDKNENLNPNGLFEKENKGKMKRKMCL
ncbi:5894_t:CDS:1, partial [Funneliformis geosporum]